MLKEFRDFAVRGNVIDLAVGVIIGGAFGKIVASLVNDILMPLIGLALGGANFAGLFLPLDGGTYATIEDAKAAGAATLNYGLFLQTVVDFVIIAFVIFLFIRTINNMKKKEVAAPTAAPAIPETIECPFCTMQVPVKARRCPHCTSQL